MEVLGADGTAERWVTGIRTSSGLDLEVFENLETGETEEPRTGVSR